MKDGNFVKNGVIFKDGDFVKSSYSPPVWKPWRCVLIARKNGMAAIRDSKDKTKTTLIFTAEEWDAFLEGVKNGEFDIK